MSLTRSILSLFALFLLTVNQASADEYRVAPEDVLTITVFDEPDLSVKETRVSTVGTIAMPLIGSVRVAGKSTTQISTQIERLLADGYLKKPLYYLFFRKEGSFLK